MQKYLLVFVVAGLVTAIAYSYGLKIEYTDYKDVLGALLNISSIIFAIIGAWIAIIYPKAIGRIFGSDGNAAKEINDAVTDTKYLAELVEIVLVSASVLMAVLTIQFAYPILEKLQCLPLIIGPCKLSGFFLITFMTFLQLYAVFRVILANYYFLNELHRKNISAQVDKWHK